MAWGVDYRREFFVSRGCGWWATATSRGLALFFTETQTYLVHTLFDIYCVFGEGNKLEMISIPTLIKMMVLQWSQT